MIFKTSTLLAYLAASGVFLACERRARGGKTSLSLVRSGVALLALGAVLQIVELSLHAQAGKRLFLDLDSSLEALSVCWVFLGTTFILRLRVPLLGLIVAPIATLAALVVEFLPPAAIHQEPELTGAFTGIGLFLHASSGFLGYAAFFTAALGGGLFLLQDHQLRRKHWGVLFDHLPPLEKTARIMRGCVWAGLTMVAAAIVMALLFLSKTVPAEQIAADPNIKTATALWIYAFAIPLVARRHGWADRRIGVMTLLLGLLILALRTLFAFGGGLHSFGHH